MCAHQENQSSERKGASTEILGRISTEKGDLSCIAHFCSLLEVWVSILTGGFLTYKATDVEDDKWQNGQFTSHCFSTAVDGRGVCWVASLSTYWVFFFVQKSITEGLPPWACCGSKPAAQQEWGWAQRNRERGNTCAVRCWQSVSPAGVRSGCRCWVVSSWAQKPTIPPVQLISSGTHWAVEPQSRAGGRVQPAGQQVLAVLRKGLCEKYWFCFDFSSGFSVLKASNKKTKQVLLFWVDLLDSIRYSLLCTFLTNLSQWRILDCLWYLIPRNMLLDPVLQ